MKKKKIAFAFLGLIIVLSMAFVLWAELPFNAMDQAMAVFNSNDDSIITKQSDFGYEFWPKEYNFERGFIIYPGARVDADAYSPLATYLAEKGIATIIVKMPLKLAIFNSDIAEDIIEEYDNITLWTISGHSLGGAMACKYIYDTEDEKIDSLVLLASYPAASNDLSEVDIEVLSLYATNDGFATVDKINDSKENLPEDTQFDEIVGGNHEQFGWYGHQPGDGEAEISREEQQTIVNNKIIDFISNDSNK
ncbi:alpha/beta hydrolase [Clostridium sp. DL1XJH146]